MQRRLCLHRLGRGRALPGLHRIDSAFAPRRASIRFRQPRDSRGTARCTPPQPKPVSDFAVAMRSRVTPLGPCHTRSAKARGSSEATAKPAMPCQPDRHRWYGRRRRGLSLQNQQDASSTHLPCGPGDTKSYLKVGHYTALRGGCGVLLVSLRVVSCGYSLRVCNRGTSLEGAFRTSVMTMTVRRP